MNDRDHPPRSAAAVHHETVDDETLREWIEESDPYRPIGPENRRYIDFYEVEVEGQTYSLRGEGNVLLDLYEGIVLSKGASCQGIEGLRREDYPRLAQLLDNYLVLCYRNGEGWYEVHPLVRDHVRQLVAELEGAPQL